MIYVCRYVICIAPEYSFLRVTQNHAPLVNVNARNEGLRAWQCIVTHFKWAAIGALVLRANASSGAMAWFSLVWPPQLTGMGALRYKDCIVHDVWAAAGASRADSGKAEPEYIVFAPCTLGSSARNSHDEATRIPYEWSLCASRARTDCAGEAGWN